MDEDDYRKYLIMVSQLQITNGLAKNQALDILFEKMSGILDCHKNSMTYQRDSMISKGGLVLLNTNNPRGLQNITFTASIPTDNVTTLAGNYRWFTDDEKTTEGSSSDPVKDIKAKVRALKGKGIINFHIEVDEISFLEDMQHSKWLEALGRATNSLIPVTSGGTDIAKGIANAMFDDEIKATFQKICGVPVIYSKSIVAIEQWNDTTKKLERPQQRSFKANTYVFVPNGNIGTIKTVTPLTPDTTGIYGTIFNGKGLIKYSYNVKTMVQDWWSELTSLCVPNMSNDMYYLYTK